MICTYHFPPSTSGFLPPIIQASHGVAILLPRYLIGFHQPDHTLLVFCLGSGPYIPWPLPKASLEIHFSFPPTRPGFVIRGWWLWIWNPRSSSRVSGCWTQLTAGFAHPLQWPSNLVYFLRGDLAAIEDIVPTAARDPRIKGEQPFCVEFEMLMNPCALLAWPWGGRNIWALSYCATVPHLRDLNVSPTLTDCETPWCPW